MPTANVAVLMPKSMTFKPAVGTSYQPVTEEPNIQTYVMKNAAPGKSLEFTISGTGSIPRDDQGSQAGQQPGGTGGAQGVPGNMPGGGIGTPDRRARSPHQIQVVDSRRPGTAVGSRRGVSLAQARRSTCSQRSPPLTLRQFRHRPLACGLRHPEAGTPRC